MAVIAVDLGGTKVLGALFRSDGEIFHREERYLCGASGDKAGDIVLQIIDELGNVSLDERIDAIGICVPGISYSDRGTVWAPNIPGWGEFPLRSCIQNHVGSDVRIDMESDRTCYILGEMWKGTAKGCRNAIFVAVGTGIGAGILCNGRILHGSGDIAGAAGWMALQYPYSKAYDLTGCFEHYASGEGLGLQIREAVRNAADYDGPLRAKPVDELTSHDVFDSYEKGDILAAKVLDRAVGMWGMASANLVSLFNPEKVIFGGGVFGPARQFIDRIYAEACRWGQPIAMRDVKFCASETQGDAAIYGAAYLTLGYCKK